MTVETHLFVCLDADGNPERAYHTREEAHDAVESNSYADEDIVDAWPDVPLMEEGSR